MSSRREQDEERPRRRSPRGSRHASFQDLMRWRADNIILASSLYDSFILAEDGHLNELILGEFLGLNLSHIPHLTRVSTGEEALELSAELGGHSMIIGAPQVGETDAHRLARRVRELEEEVPFVLLAFDNRELSDLLRHRGLGKIDRAFLWQGDLHLVLGVVKYVEDRMNVAHDVEAMGVQVIIVIEDNVRYYSSFLPMIYDEVVRHTRGLIPEGVNLSHKLLRIRARPKILLCSTFEEAWDCFSTYQSNVLGIISDIEFPKGGELTPDAGVQFARRVLDAQPDVPVLLHSGRRENEELARDVGASFLLKGSPTLLHGLREFMLDNFGFGDFVFQLPDGTEVGRATDLRSLEEQIETVPAESLAYHGVRNHFSVWLKAHTEFEVAHRLRPRKVSDFSSYEHLRQELVEAIRKYRRQRHRGSVVDFDPETFDPEFGYARIGEGSLGGKARGLAFANHLLVDYELEDRFEGIHLAVPPFVVISTQVFDRFMSENELLDLAVTSRDDEELLERFFEGEFPEEVREALRGYLEKARYPLAVRSSSLLEDSKYQPFAGIYETLMLPNNDPDPEARLRRLLQAVKRVYASTYREAAKRHVVSTPYRLEEEKMAVILQKLVGTVHENRFYPDFAGVGLSQNFYPTGPMKPEDGMAAVALGLGPTVVEGEKCLQFSPRHPRRLVQFSSVEDTLESSQRTFYALRLDEEGEGWAGPGDSAGEAPGGGGIPTPHAELGKYDLDAAEEDGTLRLVGSTYDPDNDAIYDDVSRKGVRLVTFAPILKYDAFPLPEILDELLGIGVEATGVPVEIEYAVVLDPREREVPGLAAGDDSGGDEAEGLSHFALLQLRPVSPWEAENAPELEEVAEDEMICESSHVLGNGVIDNLRDLIVVDYERFEREHSRVVAQEVSRFNAQLLDEGLPYLLVGVGRWGSNDPLLGIPVTWGQIAGARAIVEAGFKDLRVTPSQGTHFFQNITSHKIGYFTVNPEVGEGFVDWSWLGEQDAVEEGEFVRRLRFDEPVIVVMDGGENEGMILKPGVRRPGELGWQGEPEPEVPADEAQRSGTGVGEYGAGEPGPGEA